MACEICGYKHSAAMTEDILDTGETLSIDVCVNCRGAVFMLGIEKARKLIQKEGEQDEQRLLGQAPIR